MLVVGVLWIADMLNSWVFRLALLAELGLILLERKVARGRPAGGSRGGTTGAPEETCNWRRGGDSNPRTSSRPSTVFETAAFNRSATSPRGSSRGQRGAAGHRGEVSELA